MAALLIPATLTAVVVGITEPLEFTFLFIAPYLFVLHAVLAASMDTLMYAFGVVVTWGWLVRLYFNKLVTTWERTLGHLCSTSCYRLNICSDLLLLIQILNFEI